MTAFSNRARQVFGFGGWDAVRPRKDCLMCRGTGHAGGNLDDPNECGFCEDEEDNNEVNRTKNERRTGHECQL